MTSSARAALAVSFAVVAGMLPAACRAADADCDGLGDSFEHQLLQDHAPHLRFAQSEAILPCDWTFFVDHSRFEMEATPGGQRIVIASQAALRADPSILLSWTAMDAQGRARSSDFMRDPENNASSAFPRVFLNIDDAYRGGQSASEVLARGNVGLYGHCNIATDPAAAGGPADFYVLQYWQLFPFNDLELGGSGNHEGDWNMFEVFLDAGLHPVAQVWFHHGDKTGKQLAGFDLTHFHGFDLGWLSDDLLFTVASLDQHADVYVGPNDHEFYPDPIAPVSATLHYLARDVPNVGEVGAALGDADVLLRYNGSWGDGGGINGSPEGLAVNTGVPWAWGARGQGWLNGEPVWTNGLSFPYTSVASPLGTLSSLSEWVGPMRPMLPGTLWNLRCMAGTYPGSIVLNKPMRLTSFGGPAKLGR